MDERTKNNLVWVDVQEVKRLLKEGKLQLIWTWEDVPDELFKERATRLLQALKEEGIQLPVGFVIKTRDIH